MIPSSPFLDTVLALGAGWLVSYAIHSTLLLGAVWLISRRTPLSPGMLDTLWKAALLGGLATATWQMTGLGLEPLGGRMALGTPVSSHDPGALFGFALPGQALPADSGAWRSAGAFLAEHWPTLVLGLWVLGALLGFLQLLWLRVRMARVLGERRPVTSGPVYILLRRLTDRAGAGPVLLTTSRMVSGPVALGRREICLPQRAIDTFSPEQHQNVLAHELAHLIRRDPVWRWVTAFFERLFFFQPLNRVARNGMKDAAEFLCDDWAVRHTGQRLTLAKCLLQVAGWVQPRQRPVAAPGMAERGSPLVRRVDRLLGDPRRREASGARRAMVAMAMLLVGAMVSPGVKMDRQPASPSQEDSENSFTFANSEAHAFHAARTPFYRMDEPISRPVPSPQALEAPPASSPSLIVVPETSKDHAVIFTVETSLDPVRIRLDRLVVELERLQLEVQRMDLEARVPRLKELVQEHEEILPRLLELRDQLEHEGTLHLEVWAPSKVKRTKEIKELQEFKVLKERVREERRRHQRARTIRTHRRTPTTTAPGHDGSWHSSI